MAKSRFVLHPVLADKRSRYIFFMFLAISLAAGILSWYKLETALTQAGLQSFELTSTPNFLLSILLSKYVRGGLVFCTAVFSCALTAHLVVGPVRRIERWLLEYEQGHPVKPLKVRTDDKFSRLVSLLNLLCG